ncbi:MULTISPECIES: cytochrome c3 family protein [Geobacter]|uniref:Cytochrome C n=2 Tax=Geobacter TaxID=28231 RepID=A0A0C1TW76_9BACT|nr:MULTISPECIES: cytochrome c3 family protein [Geobacter]ANA41472.1 cytochrome C [Geobacter anodireducens]KIE43663.1 cytochrome C [Geobacter soli]MBE2888533.1 cytochrome c3 family protein [Geobacter anodireducens]HMN01640.1 cytochrome c3 family protein [Geobacter anodireducens]
MNMHLVLAMAVVWFVAGDVSLAGAFECNVCHSKNPAMVTMHEAVRGRGCFGCHKVGERLMGKGQPKDKASLMERRVKDAACIECHKAKQQTGE